MDGIPEAFKYLQFPALILAVIVIVLLFRDRKESHKETNKTIDNLAVKVATLSEIVKEVSVLNKLLMEKFLRKD